MLRLIEQNRPQIETLCRQHHVLRLELFGSAARSDFDEAASDLDFFVEFETIGWVGASDRYFGLLHDLEDLFARHIDLVDRAAVTNAIFLDVADRNRELIYAASVAKAS
jgi:uncharacterized protein